MKCLPNRSRMFAPLALTLVAFAGLGQAQMAQADVAVYRDVLRATTWVLSKNSEGTSSGTGVLIDQEKKLVVTNAHVVGDSRSAVVFFPEMDGEKPRVSRSYYLENVRKIGIRGRVIAVDRKRDLALVELEKLPENAQAITMAEESIGPGETVQSVGNPGSTEALWVYTSGTVRAVYRKQFRTGAGEHDFNVVETQSPINSGDSGGPVVNSDGKLVAVAQAIASSARLVSYFIDISEVKAFMNSQWKLAPLPVTDVLDKTELKYTQHASGHYEISFDGDDKEKLSVFIAKNVEYYERADVRKIWALAQVSKEVPSAELTMKLLDQNARTKLGSWAVEKTKEGEFLLVYCVKLDATATPDVVKSSMEYVAKLTVAMKKDLLKKDDAESASETLKQWLK